MLQILLSLMLTSIPAAQWEQLLYVSGGIQEPKGKGTGLGLSITYDIVKAHGGELKVETKEGIGTTFTIDLP